MQEQWMFPKVKVGMHQPSADGGKGKLIIHSDAGILIAYLQLQLPIGKNSAQNVHVEAKESWKWLHCPVVNVVLNIK